MPNPGAGEPITRVSLNLFNTDIEMMEHVYGWGWSVKVRELIRDHVRTLTKPKTIGDLDE